MYWGYLGDSIEVVPNSGESKENEIETGIMWGFTRSI